MLMALVFLLVFLASIGFAILGQGGGVLYTPIQYWLGIDFHTAASTSLFLIMVMSFSSSLVFRKANRIDWKLALVLETITTIGAFAGGLWSARISSDFLSLLLGLVIATCSYFMIKNHKIRATPTQSSNRFFSWKRSIGRYNYSINLGLALPISFFAGLISGMIGVGGGILKVPTMVLLLGVPIKIAVGSSALMVGMTAFGGFLGHVINDHWDWKISLFLAAAVFFGAQIGSRLSIKVNETKLRRVFAVFLILIAVMLIFETLMQ